MLLNSDFIKNYGISANGLKYLALILMITDHIGAVLFPEIRILRYIGRLSFPIYCFLITEGFLHTRNVYKYGLRLLIFALMSEVPFDLAVYGKIFEERAQNVFFTLFLGLLALYFIEFFETKAIKMTAVIICIYVAIAINADYTYLGILMILFFYIFRENVILMVLSVFVINFYFGLSGTGSQKYAALSIFILFMYSGKKKYSNADKNEKKKINQMIFYAIYPIHLLMLYFIKVKF